MATVTGDFKAVWDDLGGEAGALGPPTSDLQFTGPATYQLFRGGMIVQSQRYGIHAVWGPTAFLYTWTGGPAGYLIASDVVPAVSRLDGKTGTVCYLRSVADDSEAWIYAVDGTKQVAFVRGDMVGRHYVAAGGPDHYGFPVPGERFVTGADGASTTIRRFASELGLITQHQPDVTVGAHSGSTWWMKPGDTGWMVIGRTVQQSNGTLSTKFMVPPSPGAAREIVHAFQSAAGTRIIAYGAIAAAWDDDDGSLGDPLGPEVDAAPPVRRTQAFERGRIDWYGDRTVIVRTSTPGRADTSVSPPAKQPITMKVLVVPPFDPTLFGDDRWVVLNSLTASMEYSSNVENVYLPQNSRQSWASSPPTAYSVGVAKGFSQPDSHPGVNPPGPRDLRVSVSLTDKTGARTTARATTQVDWQQNTPVSVIVRVSWDAASGAWRVGELIV